MQATLDRHVPRAVRLDGARATLSALIAALLAMFGVYSH